MMQDFFQSSNYAMARFLVFLDKILSFSTRLTLQRTQGTLLNIYWLATYSKSFGLFRMHGKLFQIGKQSVEKTRLACIATSKHHTNQ